MTFDYGEYSNKIDQLRKRLTENVVRMPQENQEYFDHLIEDNEVLMKILLEHYMNGEAVFILYGLILGNIHNALGSSFDSVHESQILLSKITQLIYEIEKIKFDKGLLIKMLSEMREINGHKASDSDVYTYVENILDILTILLTHEENNCRGLYKLLEDKIVLAKIIKQCIEDRLSILFIKKEFTNTDASDNPNSHDGRAEAEETDEESLDNGSNRNAIHFGLRHAITGIVGWLLDTVY